MRVDTRKHTVSLKGIKPGRSIKGVCKNEKRVMLTSAMSTISPNKNASSGSRAVFEMCDNTTGQFFVVLELFVVLHINVLGQQLPKDLAIDTKKTARAGIVYSANLSRLLACPAVDYGKTIVGVHVVIDACEVEPLEEFLRQKFLQIREASIRKKKKSS